MANRGWTIHQAVKNQFGATQQGGDLNKDGAVTMKNGQSLKSKASAELEMTSKLMRPLPKLKTEDEVYSDEKKTG